MTRAATVRDEKTRDQQATGLWARLKPRVPSLFATYLGLLALYGFVRALIPPLRLYTYWPTSVVEVLGLPASVNLAWLAFLVILAGAVARRKRVAGIMLTILLGLALLLNLVGDAWVFVLHFVAHQDIDQYGPDIAFTAVGTVVVALELAVLVAARHEFYARVQRGSFWKATATLAVGLGLSFGISYLLVSMSPGTLHGRRSRASWALHKLLGSSDPFHGPGGGPHWISTLTGFLAAVALFAALLVLLRSQRTRAVLPPDAEARIRTLLAESGERDSLGYFATRRDKSAIFSPSGKAAITYRVVQGVCLASGDPIGDPEAWRPAIEAWLTLARRYAWTPAVMGASEEGARAYRRVGLRVLQLGDEAILTVAEFYLDGREMRGVRQAVRRVERAGYTARIRRHRDIPANEMAEIIARADAWRDTETERGFSMALGRLGDPNDSECVLVEAIGPDGSDAALLSFAPWGRHGLSLDLMRRDRAADNGLMEFMVCELVEAAPLLSVARISLNFAVFRSAFEEGSRIGAGPVLRLWRKLLLFFSRWWQIESLYRANVKYRPQWLPRYLCFGEARDVAKVGLASAIAEGFLTVPSLSALLNRGRDRAAGEPVLPSELPVEPAGTPGDAAPPAERPGPVVPEQVAVRVATMEKIRASGSDPYPVTAAVPDTCAELSARFGDLPPDTHTGEYARIAGRVLLNRDLGGVVFVKLRDATGDLQVMLTGDRPELAARWRAEADLGDQIAVDGEVVTSRNGELSVLAHAWTMTAKCLRPLPNKHSGLADPESRVRQRYLDLAVNPTARQTLAVRSAAVRSLRDSLHARGFMEVETPVLQRIHGGANARPFRTEINAYDLDLYLRIAPELYLKRLCVGGVGKVFELGRTFRNEGVDATHNPEFTMLEAYEAYGDYRTMLVLAREMIQEAATAAYGSPVLRRATADGGLSEVDISGDWRAVTVNDAVGAALDAEITADTGHAELVRHADRLDIPVDPAATRGEVLLELYERLVEHRTVEPTFYLDFPTDVSPLTRQHRDDDRLAERWDLVAFGAEIGTAYTELTDPVEQRRRLTEQSLKAAGGDPEAMELDEDFLRALEYGMPPTGGLGLGVDRLVMLLTGLSIRDTLPFPLVRPASR
ncbi:bifunctional lysylphosphatidylglycerol synthetase/lysine--tRNA ligase LysX [Actinocatenispora rupis]|uniref:Lysine--tRNA ligase n=1 Tax=Actinocatenispora rupis TaxID=519421 RepID=A0A8J3IZ76_9ACTN|nr:bifunctional lysylphosphatidylglycerol synthetase/lysine--tRNA ligase LysX [Actinocatenispora rupis]GID12746.1 lysine--tRNA ligase [Actinocatenispora rupis]